MKPKVIDIIKADQASKIALAITAVTWALCLWTVIYPFMPEGFWSSSPLTGSDAPNYLKSALGTTLLAAGVIAARLLSVLGVFKNGAEVTGSIKIVRIKGSRGYIIYTYSYEGKEYSKTASLNFTKKMKALYREGGPISLAVNANRPSQSLVRDLYFP
ncbi:MAG TPA: hypothetical protein PLM53_05795 [Spirochaetota bacterium]|nr:hypothetical protein [Spirochaetota bacterium]HPC42378.1 hypothetical protein [Spirochaetota bacterium]HPL16404.1 hypothetical protein [Spirochaetota bacterium]HQF08033.1 hypothetical protein [Spirochaetota bacterium]HQH96593.1 hypothetical protein [Spirochaetota bacterium]